MKKTLSYFLPYLKNYKKEIILAVIGMVAVALSSAASAHLMKPVLDEMFINKDKEMLVLIPFAIIALFTIKATGNFVQSYFMVYVGEDIVRKLRDRMVFHLMHQDMNFLQMMRNGELISRVTSDITRIRSLISSIMPSLLTNIITIFALMIYVLYRNVHLALYFFTIIPILAIPIVYLSKLMKRYSHRSQESNSDMTSRLAEIFNNIEIIKAHFAHNYEIERFKKESQKVFDYLMKQNKISMLSSPTAEVIGSFALALVLYMGATEVMEGSMTVGEFFAFMAALAMLYGPIKALSRIHTKLQDAVAAFERIDSLLQRDTKLIEGTKEAKEIYEVIFDDVSLKYEDKLALSHISLKASKGKVYALVGNSGAGKSSLVSLMVRFYEPTSGRILIDGVDIKEYSLASLLQRVSFVTQRVFIFNDTIAHNVAYSADYDKERVIKALKKAHAWEFVSKLENGIYTHLDEFGANLSGGQRQRIALARALYKDPSVLILDEATSALDNRSEEAIQQALEEIKGNMITFIVAHRLSTIENADEILLFDSGKIVARGDYNTLLKTSLLFRELARVEEA